MHEVMWAANGLKSFKLMEGGVSRHKRSISDPVKRKSEENLSYDAFDASSCNNPKLMGQQHKGSVKAKKSRPAYTEVQSLLKEEILDLQEQLQDQYVVRLALEKALNYKSYCHDTALEKSIPKPAEELIKEIALLESEVVYLERYLLSLYRRAFDEQILSLSSVDGNVKSSSTLRSKLFPEVLEQDTRSEKESSISQAQNLMSPRNSTANPVKECQDNSGPQMLLDSSICRSHSSLSQRSAGSTRSFRLGGSLANAIGSYHSLCSTADPVRECQDNLGPQMLLDSGICRSHSSLSQRSAGPTSFRLGDSLSNAIDSYHSLPLSILEQEEAPLSCKINLSEDLGTCVSSYVSETPNWISEEMVKCISAMYCELADPASVDCYPSSPTAFSTAMDDFSSQDRGDMQSRKFSTFNSSIHSPSNTSCSNKISRPYCTMVKVQWISRESEKLKSIDYMLRKFRRLVSRLEETHPRLMKHEDKLAFWINVHNALVMHAYLVYGIPQNNLKRMSVILQAAYNIGGRNISLEVIQSSILGCRLPRPGQWLRNLLTTKTKFKVGDRRKAYAIEHPEPLLYFALCSGSQSDPAVRVYTPERVFQELEAAKAEYIQSTFSTKGKKILLPKIVESFAKQSDLCNVGLTEMIERYVPKYLIHKHNLKKDGKNIQWMPHNFSFCYIFSRELA